MSLHSYSLSEWASIFVSAERVSEKEGEKEQEEARWQRRFGETDKTNLENDGKIRQMVKDKEQDRQKDMDTGRWEMKERFWLKI